LRARKPFLPVVPHQSASASGHTSSNSSNPSTSTQPSSSPRYPTPSPSQTIAISHRLQTINQCYHLLTSTCTGCYVTGTPMTFSHTVNNCPNDFANDSDELWREFRRIFRGMRSGCFGCSVPNSVRLSSYQISSKLTRLPYRFIIPMNQTSEHDLLTVDAKVPTASSARPFNSWSTLYFTPKRSGTSSACQPTIPTSSTSAATMKWTFPVGWFAYLPTIAQLRTC
jgi:hypothetical protein